MTKTVESHDLAESPLPFRIRFAVTGDAYALVDYLTEILNDPSSSIADADEMLLDGHREREHLRRLEVNPNGLALIAETTSKERDEYGDVSMIIGYLTLEPGRRRKIGHVVELGMSVREDWRGHGVGSALIGHSLEWAMRSGTIEKVCLNVFSENIAAIKLYERAGFEIEGRLKRQIKLGSAYQDLILMAKIIRE